MTIDKFTDSEALRAAAFGRTEMLEHARSALSNDDASVSARTAIAAVLLGDRGISLEELQSLALRKGRLQRHTLELTVRAWNIKATRSLLHQLSRNAADIRLLVIGAGAAGDAHYVPWLIRQTEEPKLSRCRRVVFSSGRTDLARDGLERNQSEGFELGPTDDPADPNVDMDPDESVPWPDTEKVVVWWNTNKHRFEEGVRYLMGAPPTREHCIQVLKDGYQRQRIAVAQ